MIGRGGVARRKSPASYWRTMKGFMKFSMRSLTPALGAEITGIDLSAPVDADNAQSLRLILMLVGCYQGQ